MNREAISYYKLRMGCIDCGYNSHAEALDFDHIDPLSKTMPVSALITHHRRMEDILEEIEKCEVVCSNCHRIRTARRRREKNVWDS